MTLKNELITLKQKLAEINHLKSAAYVLVWDQSTYMPEGGAVARGRHLATLQSLAHERFTTQEIGRLIEKLSGPTELPYDSDDACLVRKVKRDYDLALKIPPGFMARVSEHAAELYQAWTLARPTNAFSKVKEGLEKTLELSQEYASFYSGHDHLADPFIDASDEGMTVKTLIPLFESLKTSLVPLVEEISVQAEADDACMNQKYSEAKQLAFGLKVAEAFGYDLKRGRLDKTFHPFAINFSVNDVRITTRVAKHDLREALFSTLHEAGHAMYEQGVSPALEDTPLAQGTSAGVHESQSRLWENLVGRSRAFWEYYYPKLQSTFPKQLKSVSLDTFYRAANKVKRSLIRTDADELTYNLHVIIRFELELGMLEGKLSIRDLPEAWRAKYQDYLGTASADDKDGVLQDVHWYAGLIGGQFQGYTLGNIMSAQFFEAAVKAQPDISVEICHGKFQHLHSWLKDNIYQHGSKFTAQELLERSTGQAMTTDPYIRYLKTKFSQLYELAEA